MAQTYFSKAPKFNPAAFSQGTNLGMFNLNALAPSGVQAKGVVPEGVDPTTAYTLEKLFPSTDPNQAWELDKKRMEYIADLQEKQAERRQKFGEESTGKAVLYQALANIGPTIAQAVNPSYLMEAGTRISSAASEAFRSVPSMNVQTPGYNLTQFRYFQ